jgi:hypothetical protein
MSDKSLTDVVKIRNTTEMPWGPKGESFNKEMAGRIEIKESLGIVGACASCGSPIYGKKTIHPDVPVQVVRSCCCGAVPMGGFGNK